MYSPFPNSKNRGFEPSDVQALLDGHVAEGFYVEYKSELVTPLKIARSIASFANTYGGWYIVGVSADKKTNAPSELTPILLAEKPDPVSTVRDAIKAHLSPLPSFFTELVQVERGAILIIQIPDGQDKPIVSSDGRIYRRKGDSSDPVFEADRYALDRMVSDGKQVQNKFLNFSEDKRTMAKGDDGPWLSIFLAPYPDVIDTDLPFGKEDLAKFKEKCCRQVKIPFGDTPFEMNMDFHVVQTGSHCVRATLITRNELYFNQLEMEFHWDGWCRIHLPIPIVTPSIGDFPKEAFKKAAEPDMDLAALTCVDIGAFVANITCLSSIYLAWVQELGEVKAFKTSFQLENVWRVVPFSHSATYTSLVADCGLPIVRQERIDWPGSSRGYVLFEEEADFHLWAYLSVQVCQCLGLGIEESLASFYDLLDRQLSSQTTKSGT